MSDSIYVIHDSKELRERTRRSLAAAGYSVACADDVGTALTRSAAGASDLILLQWSGSVETETAIGGFKSEQDTRTSRIVVVAVEDAIGDAIVALEFGADDCLAVPLLLDRVAHRLFVQYELPFDSLGLVSKFFPTDRIELQLKLDNILDEQREFEQVNVDGEIARVLVQDVGLTYSLSGKWTF